MLAFQGFPTTLHPQSHQQDNETLPPHRPAPTTHTTAPSMHEQCQTDGSGLGSLDASLPYFGGDRRELPAAGGKEANQISGKGVKKARPLPDTKATKNVID